MSAIAWWVLPIAATLLAVGWATWAGRRQPKWLHDSSGDYERFQAALSSSYRSPEPVAPRRRREARVRLGRNEESTPAAQGAGGVPLLAGLARRIKRSAPS